MLADTSKRRITKINDLQRFYLHNSQKMDKNKVKYSLAQIDLDEITSGFVEESTTIPNISYKVVQWPAHYPQNEVILVPWSTQID